MINNRYKIESLSGEGRSKTFLCTDTFLNNKKLAMKILANTADTKEERLFKEEFLTLRKLSHKNIIKAYEYRTISSLDSETERFGILGNCKFFTMDFIEGKRISDFYVIEDESLLTKLLIECCKTLLYLHTFNYIFKDLKAENILVFGTYDSPEVRLIDFGAICKTNDKNTEGEVGTHEYLAPELLDGSNNTFDIRVDLYALGILFYYLVYGNFPFESESNVQLFKAHLEKDPDFPNSPYSDKIITIIKKLLQKVPQNRFQNAYQILQVLGAESESGTEEWAPAKVFVRNNLMMSLVNDFLYSQKVDKAVIIRGPEGSGKTSLLDEIYYNFRSVIIITKSEANSNKELSTILLNKILFNPYLYNKIEASIFDRILFLINNSEENSLAEIRAVLIEVCTQNKFIIQFDDFNEFSPKALDLLREVIPIFLVYEIKVIITENNELDTATGFIESPLLRITQPFDEILLKEYLDKTFCEDFEKDQLIKILQEKTDLLPGSIDYFLVELFYNQVLTLDENGLKISQNNYSLSLLEESFSQKLNSKLVELTPQELIIIQILASISLSISAHSLVKLAKVCPEFLEETIRKATDLNILKEYHDGEIEFNSKAVKNIVYESIEDKTSFHLNIAEIMASEVELDIPKIEIADQYEKGDNIVESFNQLIQIVENEENLNFYSYLKEILERAAKLKVDKDLLVDAKSRLCQVYLKLGEFNSALALVNTILKGNIHSSVRSKLSLIKAEGLLEVGKLDEARELYDFLYKSYSDLTKKAKIEFELANIEFLNSNFEQTEVICVRIITNKTYRAIHKANALNLLGIIKYKEKDFNEAITFFNKALLIYNSEHNFYDALKIELNIGTAYSELDENEKAKYHWERSQIKNKQVGSLESEAFLLLNYGACYFKDLNLEKSKSYFSDSFNILNNIGHKEGKKIALNNLCETYLLNCEYDSVINLLEPRLTHKFDLDQIDEMLDIYIQMAHTYCIIGSKLKFEEIMGKYRGICNRYDRSLTDNLHYQYLLLRFSFDQNHSINLTELTNLLQASGEQLDRGLSLRIHNLFIESLIYSRQYEMIFNQYNSIIAKSLTKNNVYGTVCKNYYLSLICEKCKENYSKTSLDFLEKAYDLSMECSITELTWKITYALAEIYSNRGNSSRASDYITLSLNLLYHISENISNSIIADDYLAKKERKDAIIKLKIWKEYLT